jgi:uncharacterized Fe-S center protein
MFASFDPVALDVACADAVNAAAPVANSDLGEALAHHGHSHKASEMDYFTAVHANTNWRPTITHAQEIGLGTSDYNLIEL